jgi:hypothetical protein
MQARSSSIDSSARSAAAKSASGRCNREPTEPRARASYPIGRPDYVARSARECDASPIGGTLMDEFCVTAAMPGQLVHGADSGHAPGESTH